MRVRVIIRDDEGVKVRKQLIAHVYLDAILKSRIVVQTYKDAYPGKPFSYETRLQRRGRDEYQTLERGNQDTQTRSH